ncbi:fimbria/pilus outer membrane usher protein, partial [Proteus myxofaciens]|uniref:fimbria/pilus outer membrane usher protein n=1 Tax=Proteus myxofaciens TaxID=184072 RepID=UPI00082973A1
MNKIKIIFKASLALTLNIYPFFVFAEINIHPVYQKALSNIDNKTIEDLLGNKNPNGYYSTHIYINNQKKDTAIFYYENKNNKLTPKFNLNDLIHLNINPSFYDIPLDLNSDFLLSDYLIDFNYSFFTQSLYLTIPQKAFSDKKNILPSQLLWDDGIPALFSTYSYFGKYKKNSQIEQKVNLNSGVNLGAWRVRSHSHYAHTNKYNQFKLHSLYAYRQLHGISATFYGGRFTPVSRMLSTDKLIAIQVISSDLLSGNDIYRASPTIEDIAETQAEIKVKQQGRIIYETIVPPGPFILKDLSTIGSNELELEIKEADGRIRKSIHYFTSMPNQLKKGKYQYNFISGYSDNKYHHNDTQNIKPIFFLGEFSYGINQKITAYSAIRKNLNTDTYFSGFTLDLGRFGGLATDISYFKTRNLLKYQFRYSKRWADTKTSLNLSSAYYQSTKDKYSAHEGKKNYNIRNYYSFSIFQPIKYLGLFSINYHHKDFLNGKNRFTIGTSLSSSIKKINYSVKYQYKKENFYNGNHFSLNFYIPLTRKNNTYHWINNQFSYHSNNKDYINNTTLGGNILDNNKLGYSINYQRNFGGNNDYYTTSINTQYRGKYQSYYLNGTQLPNDNYHLRVGVNGSLVLHQDGITFAPQLGNTFA